MLTAVFLFLRQFSAVGEEIGLSPRDVPTAGAPQARKSDLVRAKRPPQVRVCPRGYVCLNFAACSTFALFLIRYNIYATIRSGGDIDEI